MRLIQRLVWPHRSEKFTQTELACSAEVFWVGETLFVFVILLHVVAIFDFVTYSGRLGRVEIATLCEGERRKGLAPSPPLFGKFQHGAFASKLRAPRKRLHCRLRLSYNVYFNSAIYSD